jgi:peptidoglycan/LPS O-acetylase OafA/YrhL
MTNALEQWFFSAGCVMIPAALLIFVMARGAGLISKVLSFPLLVLGGEISYSIYLLHWPLMRSDLHNLPAVLAQPKWVGLSVTFGILLILSFLVWAYIERPGRKWIMRMAGV